MGNNVVVETPALRLSVEEIPLEYDNTLQGISTLLWASQDKIDPKVFEQLLELSSKAYLGKTAEVRQFAKAVHDVLGLTYVPESFIFRTPRKDLDAELKLRYAEIQKAANYSEILIDFNMARNYLWKYKSALNETLWEKLQEQEIEASCGNSEDQAKFRKMVYESLIANSNVPQTDIPSTYETRNEETKERIFKARQFVFIKANMSKTEQEKKKWENLNQYLANGERLVLELGKIEPKWEKDPLFNQ